MKVCLSCPHFIWGHEPALGPIEFTVGYRVCAYINPPRISVK